MTMYVYRHDCKDKTTKEMCVGCVVAQIECQADEIARLRTALQIIAHPKNYGAFDLAFDTATKTLQQKDSE